MNRLKKIPKTINNITRNKWNRLWIGLIFVVIILGFALRLRLVLERAIWADEAFYFSIADWYTWKGIILEHYELAADNPSFFFIFLKLWSFLGKSIFWLRLPGLLVFLTSCTLLLKIFRNLSWSGRLLILSLFSFSPFFIHLNFWISPFNLVLLFSLLQFYLIAKFSQGGYQRKSKVFIISFTLLNFLLINTHYSAVYIFFLYPPLYFYLRLTNKDAAKKFLVAVVTSAIFLIPTAFLLWSKWNLVNYYLQVNPVSENIPTVFHLLVYIFDKSILRLGIGWPVFGFVLAIAALFFVARTHRVKSETFLLWLIFFLGTFILPALFLYLAYPTYPSIFVERTFLTFHLGFYFLVAYILVLTQEKKADLWAFGFFCGLLAASVSFAFDFARVNRLNARLIIPGDVTRDALIEQVDYQGFVQRTAAELEREGKWLIAFYGDNAGSRFPKDVFLRYYFSAADEFKELRGEMGQRIDFLSAKTKKKVATQGYNILLINVDKKPVPESLLEQMVEKYGVRPTVIDYWSFFPHQIDQ